ncbi:hypothetical protein SNE40_021257 [Patella caerulea]|uniref:Uncharacterized protein n=1 Tax=Patella caerulea TaxID=87958 RepID=A0AAN8IXB6_PATCE
MDLSIFEDFVKEVMMSNTNNVLMDESFPQGRTNPNGNGRPRLNSSKRTHSEDPDDVSDQISMKKVKPESCGEPDNNQLKLLIQMVGGLSEQTNRTHTQVTEQINDVERKIEERVTEIIDKRLNSELQKMEIKVKDVICTEINNDTRKEINKLRNDIDNKISFWNKISVINP